MNRQNQIAVVCQLIFLTAVISPSPSRGEDSVAESWSQFRGPQGNGVAAQAHPTNWGKDQNVAWSTSVPGGGWSSPVVANGRVFLTTAVSGDDAKPKGFGAGTASMRSFFQSKPPTEPYSFEVHCLDLVSGKPLWNKQIVSRTPPHKIHPSNSYATESPVTDGQNIYTYFAAVGIVACVDLDGELKWQRELGAYRTSSDFGTGSSLAMLGGNLFVQCDNEENSFVCALDAETGEDTWRKERDGGTSWSSPVIWNNRERTELVVCGNGNVTSYEPSTGEVLWKLSGTGGAFSASPTSDSDRIYFGNSGRNSRGPLVAVNAGASGELNLDSIGENAVAWVAETSAPGMCSPVAVAGKIYVLSRGVISCHDAGTGERLYKERLQNGSRVTSSLWAAGDKLYAINETGETSVIGVEDEFELLASNQTDGLFWSTPAVAGTALLLRGAASLHCIRQ
jgi:outer membrane protein assembly factor BamB